MNSAIHIVGNVTKATQMYDAHHALYHTIHNVLDLSIQCKKVTDVTCVSIWS